MRSVVRFENAETVNARQRSRVVIHEEQEQGPPNRTHVQLDGPEDPQAQVPLAGDPLRTRVAVHRTAEPTAGRVELGRSPARSPGTRGSLTAAQQLRARLDETENQIGKLSGELEAAHRVHKQLTHAIGQLQAEEERKEAERQRLEASAETLDGRTIIEGQAELTQAPPDTERPESQSPAGELGTGQPSGETGAGPEEAAGSDGEGI